MVKIKHIWRKLKYGNEPLFVFPPPCQLTSYATKPYSKRAQIISVEIFLALFD